MSLYESCLYSTLFVVVVLILLKVYARFTLGISTSNTCLVGKTVLITGGNSGLGFQTALALAGRGARIIIADKDDAKQSIEKIVAATNNKNVIYKYLDLSSLTSVRKFAKEINEEESRLDILINNAGVSVADKEFSEDGLQLTMQINYLSPFLLTHLLIDLLKKSAPSRIIFLSSICAFLNNLSPETINTKTKFDLYSKIYLYGNTKLASLIAANVMAKKLRGSGVTANSVHPGFVNTPIFHRLSLTSLTFFLYKILLPIYGKTPWEGAQTQIECALAKELDGVTGKYFIDCRPFVQPWKACDTNFCSKLWKKSEELVKLDEHEKII